MHRIDPNGPFKDIPAEDFFSAWFEKRHIGSCYPRLGLIRLNMERLKQYPPIVTEFVGFHELGHCLGLDSEREANTYAAKVLTRLYWPRFVLDDLFPFLRDTRGLIYEVDNIFFEAFFEEKERRKEHALS